MATESENRPPSTEEAPPRKRRDAEDISPRGKTRFKGIAIAAAVVLIVIGFFVWRHYAGWESTDDAEVNAHISSVSARVAGHVVKVNVDDNQYVKTGDVLVEIDPADYAVALERAKAEYADAQATAEAARIGLPIASITTSSQVENANAEIQNSTAGLEAAQKQAEAAQAKLRQAESDNARAQADLNRYKQLVAKDEISKQQYDQAFAAASASAANVDAARSTLAAAQEQVSQSRSKILQARAAARTAGTAPQQISVARARAASAEAVAQKNKAALQQAELNLKYASIVAPANGVIGRRSVEVGQNVQVGQEILSIVPDDVWITANFKETQLAKMRPGQPVEIKADMNGRKYRGHLESLGAASGARFSLLPPENATGNYVKVVQRLPVKIVLEKGENSDHALRPGMSVEPRVKVK